MAGQFLDYTGLAVFKDLLFNLINNKLATKQDKGDYVTKKDLEGLGIGVEYSNFGYSRDRENSDPTYGLESIEIEDKLNIITTGTKRVRDPSKPSYGL